MRCPLILPASSELRLQGAFYLLHKCIQRFKAVALEYAGFHRLGEIHSPDRTFGHAHGNRHAVAFLLSGKAGFVTGHAMLAEEGYTAG